MRFWSTNHTTDRVAIIKVHHHHQHRFVVFRHHHHPRHRHCHHHHTIIIIFVIIVSIVVFFISFWSSLSLRHNYIIIIFIIIIIVDLGFHAVTPPVLNKGWCPRSWTRAGGAHRSWTRAGGNGPEQGLGALNCLHAFVACVLLNNNAYAFQRALECLLVQACSRKCLTLIHKP